MKGMVKAMQERKQIFYEMFKVIRRQKDLEEARKHCDEFDDSVWETDNNLVVPVKMQHKAI